MPRAIVVGGGVAGLVCAERLAAAGVAVVLLEAAPEPGGRAGGFRDPETGLWLDRGPHLLSGAYRAFLGWCRRIGAGDELRWQPRLSLAFALPDGRRKRLEPNGGPWAAALSLAVARGWGARAAWTLARMRLAAPRAGETSAGWLARLGVPAAMRAELLEPLHLAIMNAPPGGAPAASFRAALLEALATPAAARLGWWRRPFAAGIARRARARLEALGVEIRTRARVQALDGTRGTVRLRDGRSLEAEVVVLATDPSARARLLGLPRPATAPIANLFVRADEAPPLANGPFACALPGGRWWFDLTQLWALPEHAGRLFCAVQSASARVTGDPEAELACLLGVRPRVRRMRSVVVREATALPQHAPAPALSRLVDAAHPPRPDGIPCTLELAARRGEAAAEEALQRMA